MLKKVVSFLLITVLALGCLSAMNSFAESDVSTEVYSITASPENSVINTLVTYTVKTSKNATKVQILNPDKSIHTAAYISAGFKDYVDNGDVRTWTITKRVQVTFNGHRRAIAMGDNDQGYTKFNKAPYTGNIITKINANSQPDEYIPLVPEVEEKEHGIIGGSFLQGWLCRDWSQDRWYQEFEGMKEVGMDFMVIQSVYDWALYSNGSDTQNWQTYSTNTKYCLYPTEIEELKGANCSSDQMVYMFEAAKKYDMQVYVGLISDDRWWKYGWWDYTSPDGTVNGENTYFDGWCKFNGEAQAKMIKEIWDRYSDNYADQIAGWYYNSEIWNFNGTLLNPAAVESQMNSLAKNINIMIDAINEVTPEKPLMLSPYFNIDYGTAEGYKQWWIDLLKKTNFRAGDILAPQDTVGAYGEGSIPVRIGTWIAAMADAAKTKEGLVFWVNNETFTAGYTPTAISVVIKQIEASDPYTDTHILFSWNHYYNPAYNSSFKSNHDLLVAYANSRNNPDD